MYSFVDWSITIDMYVTRCFDILSDLSCSEEGGASLHPLDGSRFIAVMMIFASIEKPCA